MRWITYTGLAALAIFSIALGIWHAARPPLPGKQISIEPPYGSKPGMLLASRPFIRGVPAGAVGYSIVFTTTGRNGQIVSSSGLALIPTKYNSVPRPVIAWAHGTTGIEMGCAPSLSHKPFDNVPGLDAILSEGWAFIATDYIGLGSQGIHAYLVGPEAAHSAIDAARAAQQITDTNLSSEVVVWGHSQGGHSALWTGSIASSYASDIVLKGVVAFAPASDLPALVTASQSTPFGKIVSSYLIHAYADAFREIQIEEYVSAVPRLISADIASRCVGGWPTLVSVLQTMLLPQKGIFNRDPTTGPLQERLRENTPNEPISAPVLILQGANDDLVLPSIQEEFVTSRCAAGQKLEYRTYANRDHISLVAETSPAAVDALQWTKSRFLGGTPGQTCQK